MNTRLQYLDLIDLISEHHRNLHKSLDTSWNEQSDISISYSEWTVLSKAYKKQPTISEIAKNFDITRQATHKIVKQLEVKQLINIMNVTHNKKEKCLQLTSLGEEYIEKRTILMEEIETSISQTIGAEKLAQLKALLRLDWGLGSK